MSKSEFIQQLIDSEKIYINHLKNSTRKSISVLDSLNILKTIVESNNQYAPEVDISEDVYKELNQLDEKIKNIDCFDSETEFVVNSRCVLNSPLPKLKKQRKPRTTKPKLTIDTT